MLDILDKADSTPGATGELTAAEYNDHKEELQEAVESTAQALSILKTPDQLPRALFINGVSAQSFQDNSIAANSIELTPITGNTGLRVGDAYSTMNGMIVECEKTAPNTSSTVTVNIGQTTGTYLGAKSLVKIDGSDIAIGEAYGWLRLYWDNSNDYWVLLPNDNSEKNYWNYIINPDGAVAQRGTTITAASLFPNNDDSYTIDRHLLLSDGNDIVDVSRSTDAPDNSKYAIKHLVATANKKFGFCRFIENEEAIKLDGQLVSIGFQAKVNAGSNIDNIRAAVISWDGAADTITSDVVSNWNAAGSDPTLVANWTYENAGVNMAITNAYQLFSIGGILIDTAGMTNIALFVWIDDTDAAINDELYVSQIRLIKNNFLPLTFTARSIKDEIELCQRTIEKTYNLDVTPATNTTVGHLVAYTTSAALSSIQINWRFKITKRTTPVINIYNTTTGAAAELRTGAGGSVAASANGTGQSGVMIINSAASNANDTHACHAIAIIDL